MQFFGKYTYTRTFVRITYFDEDQNYIKARPPARLHAVAIV